MGLAALIVYVTLGRRRIDYRFVLVGAVLPDVAAAWPGSHSLIVVALLALVVMVLPLREKRLALFGLPVGWLLHLVGDGMWDYPRVFLWPAFGTDVPAHPEPYSWDLLTDPLEHLGTWGAELAGLLLLAWFWVAFGLGHEGRARLFLKDGYLRPWDGPRRAASAGRQD